MTSTPHDLQSYLGTLSTILWNYGATFAAPTIDTYDSGEVGFAFSAELPGPTAPKPAVIKMAEIWAPTGPGGF